MWNHIISSEHQDYIVYHRHIESCPPRYRFSTRKKADQKAQSTAKDTNNNKNNTPKPLLHQQTDSSLTHHVFQRPRIFHPSRRGLHQTQRSPAVPAGAITAPEMQDQRAPMRGSRKTASPSPPPPQLPPP